MTMSDLNQEGLGRAATLFAPMLPGNATAAGTARYRDRFPKLRDAHHFR